MPAVAVMSYSLKGFNHITATPKHEMDMHAEVPVPAGGDHIKRQEVSSDQERYEVHSRFFNRKERLS